MSAETTGDERSNTTRDRLAVGLLTALFAAGVALAAYVVAASFIRQPLSDTLNYIQEEFDLESQGHLFRFLFAPHNNQRLVWFRVLTSLDMRLFGGSSIIYLVAALGSLAAALSLLVASLWRGLPAGTVRAMATPLLGLSIASTVNASGCAQPVNATYPISFGFAVLAIVLFESRDQAAIQDARRRLGGAFLAMAGGVMGCGAAIAVWPALLLSAWRKPANRPLMVATALAGVATAVALFDVTQPTGHPPAHFSLGRCWKMVQYLILYSAMPWSLAKLPLALRYLVGMGDLAIGAALLWRGPRGGGPAGRIERIGLDLIAFSLATGLLAAVGRVDETAQVLIPTRYAVYMSAFVAGLILVSAPRLADHWATARRLALPAAVAVGCALLAVQVAVGVAMIRTSAVIRTQIAAFEAGARTPLVAAVVYPDLGFAARTYEQLRKRGLYQ